MPENTTVAVRLLGWEWPLDLSMGVYAWTSYVVGFTPLGALFSISGPELSLDELDTMLMMLIASSVLAFNNSIFDWLSLGVSWLLGPSE